VKFDWSNAMNRLFTISAFTENSSGVLHRLTAVFTRRKVNVESLCVSETETKGISRFTISVRSDRDAVRKIVAQIARIIEVIHVEFHVDEEILFKEIAFIKVRASSVEDRKAIEQHVQRYGASMAYVNGTFLVVEKTGTEAEINSLFLLLEPFGIIEFVRSGRIAMVRESDAGSQTKRVIRTSVGPYRMLEVPA
jgi:acetolactate synthase I/III small subunit